MQIEIDNSLLLESNTDGIFFNSDIKHVVWITKDDKVISWEDSEGEASIGIWSSVEGWYNDCIKGFDLDIDYVSEELKQKAPGL